MPAVTILNARDVLAGEQGEVFATVGDQTICMMHVKNIEATITYNKEKIPILGKRGKGNRKTGEEYTGTMTVYFLTSAFRELAEQYKNSGEDFYFDLVIKNEDKTTHTGMQKVILHNVNLDSIDVAKLDADSAVLEEDMDFTFEDWELETSFTPLDGFYVTE